MSVITEDILRIQKIIAELQSARPRTSQFEKYIFEKKVLKVYKNILAIAEQEGIKLPQ